MGAALLQEPERLAELVAGIVSGSRIPVSVKVRTGSGDAIPRNRELDGSSSNKYGRPQGEGWGGDDARSRGVNVR